MQKVITEVNYISVWDGGFEVRTKAKMDKNSGKLIEIIPACPEKSEIVEVLEKEYIEIQGLKYNVYQDANMRVAGINALVLNWDIDIHGIECNCDNCNSAGKSYGTAIFEIPFVVDMEEGLTDEQMDYIIQDICEPMKVVFKPDEKTSLEEAIKTAKNMGYQVIQ